MFFLVHHLFLLPSQFSKFAGAYFLPAICILTVSVATSLKVGTVHLVENTLLTAVPNVSQVNFLFQVRNTRTVNRTGQLTGYKLVPGSNCLPLAGPEAKFLRRAAFLKHNLWVTPYAHGEMHPGGEFPNQNPRVGEGLVTWVKQNRSLEEADIVLWLAHLIPFL